MEIIQDIVLQTIEFLTLTFGILGMTISLMLLFSPNFTQSLSDRLNRSIDVEKRIQSVDKEIQITEFLYGHHVIMGILIVAGSIFSLFSVFFSLDILKFVGILFGPELNMDIAALIVDSLTSIGKVGCLAGLVFGFMLMVNPELQKRIDNKMNTWFTARPWFDKLDESSHSMDIYFFRHPVAVGLAGAVLSSFLIVLSLINLLK